MEKGHINRAIIVPDVRTLSHTTQYDSHSPDLITAGFPCTDISHMGHRMGLEGPQSKLVFDVLQIVSRIRPKLVLLENVPRIQHVGMQSIVTKLQKMGYHVCWKIISAESLGAPHLRKRWYCLATRSRDRNSSALHLQKDIQQYAKIWKKEPVPRLCNDVINRQKRMKSLGNAVVPIAIAYAFYTLQHTNKIQIPERPKISLHLKGTNYHFTRWGTPIAGQTNPSRSVSNRGSKMLCTQMTYDVKSRETKQSACNPQFWEWLMGYPIDWTKI